MTAATLAHPDLLAPVPPEVAIDRFGLRVAARLNEGTGTLPHHVSERLRVARERALDRRKRERTPVLVVRKAPALLSRGPTASLGAPSEPVSWWVRLASALPVLALVAGLVVIHEVQADRRAVDVATMDEAVLTDDLPPAAYADPGFMAFLQSPEAERLMQQHQQQRLDESEPVAPADGSTFVE